MTVAPTLDLAAVKARQQATWASGDYSEIATLIVPVAERLCDAADLRAGSPVIDVAAGTGNAAIAAARLGCHVTAVDYVPALLERGRERAAAERVNVDFVEGDAESLPAADESFAATVSVFGTMFAPNHRRPRPRSPALPSRAERSRSRAGSPTASSAACSGRSLHTFHPPRAFLAHALGHGGSPRGDLRRRRGVGPSGADVHVPVHVGRGARRPVRNVLRARR